MRVQRFVLIAFIALILCAVGSTAPQFAQSGSTVQQYQSAKKICGFPPPSDVPTEVWENACEACTSVPVSPEASSDGTLTSHSCDGGYEIRMSVIVGKTFPAGTMRDVMLGGGLGEEKPPNQQEHKVGEIPQVAKTFTRYNASYPFMNEKGVIIGETTISGRRELATEEGWFDIMELERLALERASTAREAITIMGKFAEQYGYVDSGECLTIGDPKEVWQFEIFGPGAGDKGAVWAAKRIPPGHVGVSANISRITTLDTDPNMAVFSKNVYDVAEKKGWWKKGDPFVFNQAIGGRRPTGSPNRREWRVLSLLAPSLKLDAWAAEQPFSVKPDKSVSVRDVMKIHRDVYEGTEFDQTKNPLGGPMGSPNRFSMPRDFRMPEGYSAAERMIAVHQASYVTVLQARQNMPPWIGSLAWFAPDDAKTSVFSPFYAGNLQVPHAFEVGRRDKLDRTSAYWASNFVGNFSNVNWQGMIQDIRAKQAEIEDKLFADQAGIEKTALEMYQKDPQQARTFINDYSNRIAQENVNKWWALADQLVVDYQDGGSRVSGAAKRTYPKEWLEKQGSFGTKLPPPKPVDVKK